MTDMQSKSYIITQTSITPPPRPCLKAMETDFEV